MSRGIVESDGVPLDYDELRRRLDQKQRAEPAPAARRPAVRQPPGPPSPAATETSELEMRRRAPLPPRPPVELIASLVTGSFLLPAIAIFLFARSFEPLESFPWRIGMSFGVVAAAVYTLIVTRYINRFGEARSAAGLWGPVALFVLAAASIGVATTGALTILNARLDDTSPTVQPAMILDKARVAARDGRSTRVTVPLWTDVGVELKFLLPETLYDQIEPRRTNLLIRTRAGAFGWMWVEDASEVAQLPPDVPVVAAVNPAAVPAPGTPAVSEADRVEARQIVERGRTQARAGQRAAAVDDFKRAIDLDPTYVAAYSELEEALIVVKQFDEMADYWSRLIDANPGNRDGFWGRARMRLARNDRTSAADDAEQACKLGHVPACQMAEKLRNEPPR